jgi:hypothetical protein
MTIALTSPVTGSAITGLTSPTYSVVADSNDSNAKRYAVTALGGTQTGVTIHTTDAQFTVTFWRPASVRVLEALGLDGVIRRFPRNTYGITIRKGVSVATGQVKQLAKAELRVDIPAGSESFDANNIAAMMSFLGGALAQQINGFTDTVKSNILG